MPIRIEELTPKSLRIRVRFNNTLLGSATGFVVRSGEAYYLVSNLHVLSGRDPATGECVDRANSAIPNNIVIDHHSAGTLGRFTKVEYDLGTEEAPKYLRHPKAWDVAVLPIKQIPDITLYATDHHHDTAPGARISVASPVSVLGFPFGLSSHAAFPIWKTGGVAGEVDLPFFGQPCFLIDAATRGGMSDLPPKNWAI